VIFWSFFCTPPLFFRWTASRPNKHSLDPFRHFLRGCPSCGFTFTLLSWSFLPRCAQFVFRKPVLEIFFPIQFFAGMGRRYLLGIGHPVSFRMRFQNPFPWCSVSGLAVYPGFSCLDPLPSSHGFDWRPSWYLFLQFLAWPSQESLHTPQPLLIVCNRFLAFPS